MASAKSKMVRRFVAVGVLNDGTRDYQAGDPVDLPENIAADLELAGVVTDRPLDPQPDEMPSGANQPDSISVIEKS